MKVLDHIAIQVKDINDSCAWYVENLHADILYTDETWAMLQVANMKLALTIASEHPPHWAIKVDSLDDFPKKEKIGSHRDGSRFVYIRDPDGNVVEYVWYPDAD